MPKDSIISLLNQPPTSRENRLALVVSGVLVAVFGIIAPYANTPLMRLEAYLPSIEAMMVLSDFITSVFLFVHYSINRSRALLALASGYLYTALIIIPHLLSFPGAFSPTGLLGADLQTTAWLYDFWHIGFPLALIVYALLQDEHSSQSDLHTSALPAISWSAAIVFGVVCSLTLFTTQGHEFLPRLFVDRTNLLPLAHYVAAFMLLVCVIALLSLWVRRRSVLDQWLKLVALTLIFELLLVAVLSESRFTLGSYTGRIFSLITSTLVLVVLLAETTWLYAQLARANEMLQREKNNKLMNLEAVTASIAHEVRQPLASIVMGGDAILRFLGETPPKLEKARSIAEQVIAAGHRASQILDNIRNLFGTAQRAQGPVNVNDLILGALRILDNELKSHSIKGRFELDLKLPAAIGHRGQLQEVIVNLIQNAIDAMDAIENDRRLLTVRTKSKDSDAVSIEIEDTGHGIDPKKATNIFDAFFTTKPNGMGLGLAICRMIIERHGGQLAASTANPHGAVFRILLPQIKLHH
ncbi:MAG TPA: MASE4 domain-containing protein [Xanthobacteraceae bacterium]|nr:MASE4 domain-containing protein [Candidatus Aquilonibacter sp.]HUC51473.1 MASE4 domain-containing protein [Xanthobacteraceae bacterium]